MRIGKYLSSLTKPELEELKEKCNFSEEESIIYDMLSKQKSVLEISNVVLLSDRTVKRRIKKISEKVERSVVVCKK